MADTEFDLGEALGSYEQAKADRNFYLSMVQGGTQMASPIAAYLAGVSNVKMANMRAKAQNIQDKRQAEKDAIAATERAQKRAANLDNQILGIMTGVRNGTLAPGAGAAMLGPVMKERGFVLKNYDADNNKMIYGMPGDPNDYEFDLNEHESMKESGLNKRQAERLAAQSALQDKRTHGQIKVAQEKAALKGGGSGTQKEVSVTDFEKLNPKVATFLKEPFTLESAKPTESEVVKYGRGIDSLPERYKEMAYDNLITLMERLEYDATKQQEILNKISNKINSSFADIDDESLLKMMPK
jgi:hypothetical protein